MKNNFYISTSIAYVNWAPHLGFAMESIIADCIARFKRSQWIDTFFITWTDEHWIKVYKTALWQWISPKELCDKNSSKFKELKDSLNLINNQFIRTSDKDMHWPTVQWLWRLLVQNWDIYKQSYEWLYCEWCECFVVKKDLDDWKCIIHKKEPTSVMEENYFFRLSKYSDQILNILKTDIVKIIPSYRKNEIINLLEWEWLKDVSFSRPSSMLPWWIPVPWDNSQNMYVWCDALTNYISALDASNKSELFDNYWNNWESVHCIWKDIVRFHAGIWLWMLLSGGIKLPTNIHIHWFLTSEWQKMSKSLWNIVDPFDIVNEYWTDALRYYLLREVTTWWDADFSKEHFKKIYNAHLANWLWNLVNRIIVMSQKNWIIPWVSNSEYSKNISNEVEKIWNNTIKHMNLLDTNQALIEAWKLIDLWNKEMDNIKPWTIKENDPKRFEDVMQIFIELLRNIAYIMESFIPNTSLRIFKILNIEKLSNINDAKKWNIQSWKSWNKLWNPEILFERLI